MSQDFHLAWTCPHVTSEEVTSLGADRRSLATRQPVASSTIVRVTVNDDVLIPQAGLFTAAQIASSVSGPFDLIEGEDVLTITTSHGDETFVFNVTGTRRFSTDQIVQFIQLQGIANAAVGNSDGHLFVTDATTVGSASLIRISGSAASALGFGDPTKRATATDPAVYNRPWQAQGQDLYPGWDLVTPANQITARYPRFQEQIRTNPIFKVTYTATAQRCLRCRGVYTENDYRFDATGQALMVANEDLLYQAALKMILTDKGSNPYHEWYGTTIRSRIGSKVLGGVATAISEDVRRALQKFQALQQEQAKYQSVTFKERLYTLLGVQTIPHAQDPTTFLVDVTVQNASSEPISSQVVYTAPGVVALMGSNGLFMGPQPTPIEAPIIGITKLLPPGGR